MSQWKLVANSSTNTSGPVQWVASGLQQGSNNTNQQANNLTLVSNDTPGDTKTSHKVNMAVGQFAFTPAAYANGTGDSKKVPGGTGWVLRRAWEGPILSLVAANGQAFANGETVLISGGSVNALAVLVANATGNLASASVLTGGTYPNGASIPGPGLFANAAAGVTYTFTHETHVVKLNIGANTAAFTNLPAANTPVTVTVSNTGANSTTGVGGGAGLVAVGTFVSNLATGITNTTLQSITWAGANTPPFANGTGFWGLFGPSQTNTAVVITFTNANGQVIANGSPAALSANLAASAGTPNVHIGTLGGRAGRVAYETLVSTRFIANGGIANASNSSVYFPQ